MDENLIFIQAMENRTDKYRERSNGCCRNFIVIDIMPGMQSSRVRGSFTADVYDFNYGRRTDRTDGSSSPFTLPGNVD